MISLILELSKGRLLLLLLSEIGVWLRLASLLTFYCFFFYFFNDFRNVVFEVEKVAVTDKLLAALVLVFNFSIG